MSVGLLDVNMLIALAWPSHVHHRDARAWFAENQSAGWATCPMTECAFVRVSSNPKIIPEAVSPIEALTLLRQMHALGHHSFWPDDLSLVDCIASTQLLAGHGQVVDAYLLGLSIRRNGKLITLDRGVAALIPADSPYRSALELVLPGGNPENSH